MSKVFRGKYVRQLRANGIEDKALIENLFQKEWVVYLPAGRQVPSALLADPRRLLNTWADTPIK